MRIAPIPPRTPNARPPLGRARTALPSALLLLLTLPGLASAGVVLSAGGGYFEPWDGDSGYEARGSILGQFGEGGHWRAGGEFDYRSFESELFNVSGVDVEAYRIGGLFHYVFLPDFFLQPYIGVKLDLAVNVIDEDTIEDARPELDVTGVGTGVGVGGIAGMDLALGDHFALFGEVVLSADAQLTDESGDLDVENVGGVSALAGLRVKF